MSLNVDTDKDSNKNKDKVIQLNHIADKNNHTGKSSKACGSERQKRQTTTKLLTKNN
ncbi:hypothetical protein ACVNPX_00215 [Staphylococcus aureus]